MNALRPTLRFASSSRNKIDEVKRILNDRVNVLGVSMELPELQTTDQNQLIRDKVLRAFAAVGQPVFVEHTGLYMECLNTLPGGLTAVFWNTLEAQGLVNLHTKLGNANVIAKTIIGYIDGKRIHVLGSEVKGTLATSPRGDTRFAWDCIFIPEGSNQTFAELGPEKDQISMRRKALDQLVELLSRTMPTV